MRNEEKKKIKGFEQLKKYLDKQAEKLEVTQ
jgi:hypothetical protein